MLLDFPDGTKREVVRLVEAGDVMTNREFATFRTYVSKGMLPSIKIGGARLVELSIVNGFKEKNIPRKPMVSFEPKFHGYD